MIINIICCLLFSFSLLNPYEEDCTNKYWDDIKDENKEIIMNSKNIYIDALKYYHGEIKMTDNKQTLILLDTLTNLKKEFKPFYFYLFNKICYEADGALASIMGGFCQKIILNNPQYVLVFLKNDKELFNKYVEMLGYELYFKKKGTSSIKYNIEEFNNILTKELKKCPEDIRRQKKILFIKIKEVITKME